MHNQILHINQSIQLVNKSEQGDYFDEYDDYSECNNNDKYSDGGTCYKDKKSTKLPMDPFSIVDSMFIDNYNSWAPKVKLTKSNFISAPTSFDYNEMTINHLYQSMMSRYINYQSDVMVEFLISEPTHLVINDDNPRNIDKKKVYALFPQYLVMSPRNEPINFWYNTKQSTTDLIVCYYSIDKINYRLRLIKGTYIEFDSYDQFDSMFPTCEKTKFFYELKH